MLMRLLRIQCVERSRCARRGACSVHIVARALAARGALVARLAAARACRSRMFTCAAFLQRPFICRLPARDQPRSSIYLSACEYSYMCAVAVLRVQCALQESTTAASEEVDPSDSPPPASPVEDEASVLPRAESAADQCAAATKRSSSAPQRRKRAPADTRALRLVELLINQPAIPFPRTCAARFANGTTTICRFERSFRVTNEYYSYKSLYTIKYGMCELISLYSTYLMSMSDVGIQVRLHA